MDQQRLIVRRERFAQAVHFLAFVVVLANKVWNHLDVVEVKYLACRLFQIVRDRGDAVRLHDAITRNRQIRSVCTDKCDISSMQRSDDRQASSRLERFAGEHGANRMWNGVMNMQQIEMLFFSDS